MSRSRKVRQNLAIPNYLAGTWKADPTHSRIGFSVRQVMVSKLRGRFTSHDVTIVTSQDPLGSSVAATIDTGSTRCCTRSTTSPTPRLCTPPSFV